MYWLVNEDAGCGRHTGLRWVRSIDVDMSDAHAISDATVSMFTSEERFTQMPLRPQDYDFIDSHWALAREKIDMLPDCFQGFPFRSQVMSQEMAESIELLEPNTHDFAPIPRVWSLRSDARVERKYVFANVHVVLPGLDREKSGFVERKNIKGQKYFSMRAPGLSESYVIDSSKVEGRHIWRDATDSTCTFVSDELKTRLEEVGCRGMHFKATHQL
ncbi:MAG: hypothetical protein N4A70_16540 [Pelagimonas sp.]|jgi:hypothetical protein|nr:hypothetical protein [Pelagimonas sp.]